MISREYGAFRLTCDYCDNAVNEMFDCFDGAVDYRDNNDWDNQRVDGECLDVCPDCQE